MNRQFSYLQQRAGVFWGALSILTLLTAALYNGFPLVTSDTGTYIFSGLHLQVPLDRPLTYGLWLRLTSLRHTLWGPVLAQSVVITYLLLRSLATWAPRLQPGLGRWLVVAAVSWGSGLPWFVGQLMPDIFTAIGVLALGLLWLRPRLAAVETLLLLGLVALAATVHASNLVCYSVLVGLVGGYRYWSHQSSPVVQRYWLTTAVVLAGWVLLPALHAAFGGGFAASRGSHVFLMGRLAETGMLDRVLHDQCQNHNWQLCQHRAELPDNAVDFIWPTESVLNRTGGWEGSRAEYTEILGVVARTPRYYPVLLEEALQATGRQLVHNKVGDGLTRQVENSNAFWKIQESFGYELKEYTNSLQNHNQLHFDDLNERYTLLLVLSGIGLLLVWASGQLRPDARAWVLLVVVALVLNAAVTANLANVLDRLQARVVWLLPFVACTLLVQHGLLWWHRLRPRFRLVADEPSPPMV
ncbi:hypothetical protein [Hymenobacter guriensis]|uniref:Glycosyltransferase RgtA/B/C/D-like domain-containing protein n=1 Tax=Hymenobacter guriensis TaxID=2793065 RepID=A0ABS0L4E2_9BACT|nr:hypothetical protein [Hymenobacter guriensis]MBG8554413.1 hypothetical protein [Hymenobacter guriensis]